MARFQEPIPNFGTGHLPPEPEPNRTGPGPVPIIRISKPQLSTNNRVDGRGVMVPFFNGNVATIKLNFNFLETIAAEMLQKYLHQ